MAESAGHDWIGDEATADGRTRCATSIADWGSASRSTGPRRSSGWMIETPARNAGRPGQRTPWQRRDRGAVDGQPHDPQLPAPSPERRCGPDRRQWRAARRSVEGVAHHGLTEVPVAIRPRPPRRPAATSPSVPRGRPSGEPLPPGPVPALRATANFRGRRPSSLPGAVALVHHRHSAAEIRQGRAGHPARPGAGAGPAPAARLDQAVAIQQKTQQNPDARFIDELIAGGTITAPEAGALRCRRTSGCRCSTWERSIPASSRPI